MPDGGGSPLLLLVADLMLESRIEETARRLGLQTRSIATLAELPAALADGASSAAVLDLASSAFPLEETLQALRAGPQASAPRLLAFYPHVNKALGEAAQRAGCTVVVPRSRFVNDLPALLSQLAETHEAAATEGGA